MEALHGEQLQSLGAGAWLRGLLLAWDERLALLMVVLAAFLEGRFPKWVR